MSGSIGGYRISRADVQPTLEAYIDKVLSKFPGFQDCAITGSYNAGTKKDHGDIDLVVYINHKDLKTLKKSFKEYLEKLPDNVTIPFTTGKRQGDKAQLFGSIVTCGFPIAGTSDPVQIDNILVTTRKDATFQKSFLNLDAQKQALFQGLVRVLLLHNDKDKIFKHFGLEEYPEPRPDQEYEFVLSTAGLSLRMVDLSPDYRELSRTEVWRSNDWEDVKWLLKDYNMDSTYEKLLDKVSKNIQDDRSRRRIVGIMKSMIRVGPGEVGTPKGDAKEAGIQLAKEKLNVNEGLKRYLQEALVHKHIDANKDLPLEYENILVPGNVVTIKCDNTIIDHIVITRDSCKYFDKNIKEKKINTILIDMDGHYWSDTSFNVVPDFPHIGFDSQAEIIGIRKVIPISEIEKIESKKDIKELCQKYRLKYEIS